MAVPLPKLTPDEYLAIEREAEYKSEYFNGEIFAMAGGTGDHSNLAADLIVCIGRRLAGRRCRVYTSDLKVRSGPNDLYTYPDVTVVCGKPVYSDTHKDVLTNPRVIFEVLSDSTEARDRGFKFRQYKQIDSLEEYVLVSQTEPFVERYSRSEGGEWTGYGEAKGPDAILVLTSLGIEIPLSEIYADAPDADSF